MIEVYSMALFCVAVGVSAGAMLADRARELINRPRVMAEEVEV